MPMRGIYTPQVQYSYLITCDFNSQSIDHSLPKPLSLLYDSHMKPDKNPEKRPYEHLKIEKKWQKYWKSKKIFNAKEPGNHTAKKFYSLVDFP